MKIEKVTGTFEGIKGVNLELSNTELMAIERMNNSLLKAIKRIKFLTEKAGLHEDDIVGYNPIEHVQGVVAFFDDILDSTINVDKEYLALFGAKYELDDKSPEAQAWQQRWDARRTK